jgi:hypothetical protein
MLRPREQSGAVGELDDLAEIHHRDAMADVLDDRDVVRDEQIGEPEIALQIDEQVDDLRLHRHVERRYRLVADNEARPQRQGAGNPDALTLTAGEFVRVAVERLGPEPDLLCQLGYLARQFGAHGNTEISQRLADDVAHRKARVQRRIGILKDHLHLPAEGPYVAFGQAVNARAAEPNLAGGRIDQLEDRLADRRFTAAAFADKTQRLAGLDVEGDIVDSAYLADGALQHTLLDREMLDEPLDRQQGRRNIFRHYAPS